MSHHDNHLHDAELGPVIDRLQAERPAASDLELGLIKQRVRGRVAPSGRRSRRTEFMRSRLAIIAMLVSGMVLSTGGGALAVSGFTSQQGNAAQAQYPGNDTGGTPPGNDTGGTPPGNGTLGALGTPTTPQGGQGENGVLGSEETGGPTAPQEDTGGSTAQGESGGVAGAEEGGGTQPARQVEAGAQDTGGEQLPFTGFAAIPILLGGVALLTSGLVLRRRAGGAG